ncbi:MAG: hypothetical protein R2759_18610 [Bacteroidales bacterium]
MHDGRFGTLEEVIAHYNSGVKANSPNLDPELDHFVGGLGLTEQDIDDLAAFLRTFTDESFLTNPDFQNLSKILFIVKFIGPIINDDILVIITYFRNPNKSNEPHRTFHRQTNPGNL